jgi:hypothetical protein
MWERFYVKVDDFERARSGMGLTVSGIAENIFFANDGAKSKERGICEKR